MSVYRIFSWLAIISVFILVIANGLGFNTDDVQQLDFIGLFNQLGAVSVDDESLLNFSNAAQKFQTDFNQLISYLSGNNMIVIFDIQIPNIYMATWYMFMLVCDIVIIIFDNLYYIANVIINFLAWLTNSFS